MRKTRCDGAVNGVGGTYSPTHPFNDLLAELMHCYEKPCNAQYLMIMISTCFQ